MVIYILAIIMAGGKGTRMESRQEKPMLMIKGKPMISYVLTGLINSNCFEKIVAMVSSNTPRTEQFLASAGVEVASSSGDDYVKDLNYGLELLRPHKVFIISADMPLIDQSTIKKVVSRYDLSNKPCLTVMVSKAMVDDLGIKTDYSLEYNGEKICNTGVCIIDSSKVYGYSKMDEEFLVMDKVQLAFNTNTKHDLRTAEKFLI